MTTRSCIVSTGAYLPEKAMSNKDLEAFVDTSDEWIVKRTGIKSRHIAAEGQTASDMAIEAAKNALSNTDGITASDIDLLIVATTTPDLVFPATAVRVQHAIGMGHGSFAFDVQAVCSGFLYALSVANSYIMSGQAKTVMVIGAEKMSAILDWEDRTTCVLFGDGAAAVILQAVEGQGTTEDQGVLSTFLHSDGQYKDILYVDGGPSSLQQTGNIVMHGREVFRHAVQFLTDAVEEIIEKSGIQATDIDWLVPHQANLRIIEATAKKIDMPLEKVILTLEKHGNTSAASVPLALHEGITDGRIKRGDLLLMEALGGGLTWGSALVRY